MLSFLAESLSSSELRAYVAVAIATLALAYVMYRGGGKRRRDPLDRQPFSSLSQQREVEKQMQSLLVEFSEMARQMSAQLDTRSRKLEMLIGDADQRIAQLEHNSQEGKSPVLRIVDSPAEENPDVDPRHAEVYALADAGKSKDQISQELNRPRGEIELILALRSRRA